MPITLEPAQSIVMLHTLTYYYNLSTGWQSLKKGSDAKSFANLVTKITVSILNESTTVKIISTGISFLEAYCNSVGCDIDEISGSDPNNYNSVQVKIYYDTYKKRTAKRVTGTYISMLSTEKCTVKKVVTEQKFLVNNTSGAEKQFTTTVNKTVSTSHYENPAPFVISSAEAYYENNNYTMFSEKVGSVSISFKNGSTFKKTISFNPFS